MYILFTTALPNPCTYLGTKNAQERLGKSDKSEISEIGNFKSLYHHKNSKETCKNVELPLLEFWKLL
jgi:hypothetical protein